ncbi:hypothetical protein DPMN_100783 [Dreissena polymorpha]|uniref:Uncharacterized protein n=1 Tax=Dreissena polymorpha TaxID=45954 RepID=A0A9D4R8I2_DREPO|nr:hypothetical protein DPMN_100783 [Dreissena polymorpha]
MWTDGQPTKTNSKTSPEQSAIFQLVQEIHKTNELTKKTAPPSWQQSKKVTSRVKLPCPGSHVIQLTGTIFLLNSRIKETNVLTKFHENLAKNVTSRVLYIYKCPAPWRPCFFTDLNHFRTLTSRMFTRKTALPTGGHLHEDWALNVTSTFQTRRDIIWTNLLTKFHEDRTLNVASRVLTNKCGRTDEGRTEDGQRLVTKAHLSNQETKILIKFRQNWAKNVTSRVFQCFHFIHIEKNSPPTGSHVFSPIWTIF